jgi:hypothetical protein
MDFTWVAPTTGDITGVTAGTGISGGGTSGDVTVTNSMATAIDAKGDLIAGTAADTFARLAVGTDGQVLKADSTASTGLAWGSAGGSLALSSVASGSLSGTSLTISSLDSYDFLQLRITALQTGTGVYMTPYLRPNASSSGVYAYNSFIRTYSNQNQHRYQTGTEFYCTDPSGSVYGEGSSNQYLITLQNCKASGFTTVFMENIYRNGDNTPEVSILSGVFKGAAAISSLVFTWGYSSVAGTYELIGG